MVDAQSQSAINGSTEDPGLTLEEENELHYVGGYVIREFKLDKTNVQMIPLVEQLTYSEKSLFDDDPMRQQIKLTKLD